MIKMKIIVCTDGSKHGDKAVRYAAQLAKNYGIDLTILNVIEDVVPRQELPTYPGFKPHKERAETIVSRAKELAAEAHKDIICHERIACGPIASEIARIAEVEGYDGIFMGTKGTSGLKRMLLGSVAEDVIRHAHCPVTVVR
jgi:nucleotide-binding universal stress UspA family protein